jgi:predicted RNase H-like HicB family nuclease
VQYEDGQDGWIIARVRELPAAMSQGRTREEARDNVLDALHELALSYLSDAPAQTRGDSEPVEVIIR